MLDDRPQGKVGSETCFKFKEKAFDLFQGPDHCEFFLSFFILFEVIAGALNREFAAAEEIIDKYKILNVYRPEKAVPFAVFPGL